MADTTLGLDLGPNSIGWALIDDSAGRIIATAVRVFPEGVNRNQKGGEVSKSENRRIARGMRRQIARRARRKKALRDALVQADLLPPDATDQAALDCLDPYKLRQRALSERLTPHEIGRLLIHLNQRRGFKSNRKEDRKKKKETSEMLTEISELAGEIKSAGLRTLGEHFASQVAKPGEVPTTRVRGRHTRRGMFEEEFEAVWAAQQKYYPNLLTEQLKYGRVGKQTYPQKPRPLQKGASLHSEYGLFGIIFYQRPMYWPKSIVGQCELEPKLKRCPRADRLAQRFRLLQEVNNLRVLDTSTGEERSLSPEERALLIEYLSASKQRTFDQIRKMFSKKLGWPETIRFNLERGDRKKLLGMPTDAILAHKDLFGKGWRDKPEDEKNAIVRSLLDDEESVIQQKATTAWGLSQEAAKKLLDTDLEGKESKGYSSYSRVAIHKLLPFLAQGLPLSSRDETPCALREADYIMPWEHVPHQRQYLPRPPLLTNPLVRQALHEVRKVVNAIIREYGRPAHIHIELAREVKGTAKDRKRRSYEMRDRERSRDKAAEEIRNAGMKVTRDAIDRYMLWNEQHRECIYSGRPISQAQLFGGEIHVDHILPRERSLDNSLMNRVLCFLSENDAKRDRTPDEWLAESNPEKFEAILQRSGRLPYAKARKFRQKSVELDDFINRQLVDTTYITTQVHEYVRCLGADIVCSKGQCTAELRRRWGLHTILSELPDSPAWQETSNLKPGEKNRADHRHHAIDAIVIALTDRSRLQQLARIRRRRGSKPGGNVMAEPWPRFRDHVVGVVKAINVSHRGQRRVKGALHEETIYGPTATHGEFVYRKPLESLTLSMIDDIRDDHVKRIVIERLHQHGIEPGSRVRIPAEVWKEPLYMIRKPGRKSSTPAVIKSVRLIKRDLTIQPIRGGSAWVKPGSIHHVCIFEFTGPSGKTRREAVFVDMLEAARRVRDGEPLIRREHPDRIGGKFVMSVSANEMVLLSDGAKEDLYRFETAASTSQQMWFRHHTAAGKSSEKRGVVSKMPNTLEGHKVTVDPLGRIRRTND